MISKHRKSYTAKQGLKTELKFYKVMVDRGNHCIKSSSRDDMYNHIDFYVNTFGIDVKGNRHLETIWLEIKNVHGHNGWLLGKADYIVFDIKELKSFCFFERVLLYDFVRNIKQKAKNKTEYMKLYTRKNRKDVLVKVTYDDIKHLQYQKISYEYS